MKDKIDQTIRENRKEAQEARDQGKFSQQLKDHWNESSAPHQNVIPRDMHDVIELTQPIKLAYNGLKKLDKKMEYCVSEIS